MNGTTSASVVESLSSVSTAEGVSNDPEAARLLTPSAADVAVAVKFAAGSNGPGRSARRRRMRLAFSSPRLVLPVHPLSPNYLEADLGNWKLANWYEVVSVPPPVASSLSGHFSTTMPPELPMEVHHFLISVEHMSLAAVDSTSGSSTFPVSPTRAQGVAAKDGRQGSAGEGPYFRPIAQDRVALQCDVSWPMDGRRLPHNIECSIGISEVVLGMCHSDYFLFRRVLDHNITALPRQHTIHSSTRENGVRSTGEKGSSKGNFSQRTPGA